MIDTDKYEGHTHGPWKASHDVLEYGHIVNNTGWRVYVGEHEKRAVIQNNYFDHDELSEANARLIADAPLLLAAYDKQVRWINDILFRLEKMDEASTGQRLRFLLTVQDELEMMIK